MKHIVWLIALAVLMAGCASDAAHSMREDPRGNYASTSDHNAMQRDEFTAAMRDGLVDFDARLASLETQADALGPDAVEEYHGCLDGSMKGRRRFVAEVERHRSMLDADWRHNREDVAELYVELRASLDEAYEEVLEEA